MPEPGPILLLFCGKMAAGKSTLAARLARVHAGVLIAEDTWLHALFADQLHTPKDYMRCAGLLRAVMGEHIAALLNAGQSVALDFQANSVESRAWMRGIVEATGARHELHLLMPPDALCLERLRRRNAEGLHPFAPTEAQFHQLARYFEPPTPEEGFNIVRHDTPVKTGCVVTP